MVLARQVGLQMRQFFPIRMLRGVFVAVGLLAAVLADITYNAPGSHGASMNPYASEFGANLRAWIALCVLSTVSLALAIFLSRGLVRLALVVLFALIWWNAMTPARHYYQYFYASHQR
jgi:hypothetical protein